MNTEIINSSEITEENLEAWTMQELLELENAPSWACAAMIVQGSNIGEYAVKYYESSADYEQDMKQS